MFSPLDAPRRRNGDGGACAINHLVANKNSACLPRVCQWRLPFPSVRLVGVASRACVSLGPRSGRARPPPPALPPEPGWTPAPAPLAPRAHRTRGAGSGAGPGAAEAAAPGSPGGTTAHTPAAPVLRAAAGGVRSGRPRARPGLRPGGPAASGSTAAGSHLRAGRAPAGQWALPGPIADPRRAGAPGAPLAGLPGLGKSAPRSVGHPEMQTGLGAPRGRPSPAAIFVPSPHIPRLPAARPAACGRRGCLCVCTDGAESRLEGARHPKPQPPQGPPMPGPGPPEPRPVCVPGRRPG